MMGDEGAWIVTGRVLAISFPDEHTFARFKTLGIARVINLTETAHQTDHYGGADLEQHQIPIPDFTAPTQAQIDTAIAVMDEALERGQAVAVHCHAGLGRTGTICACYLVRTGLSAEDAVARVRTLRPGSIETPAQEEAVRSYALRAGRVS
jgi:atypical dual specificity phosphatase